MLKEMDKKSFPWGKVIETFTYDMDGDTLRIVKFHPWDYYMPRVASLDKVEYYCEDMSMTGPSLQYMVLAWIAWKNLGMNQEALVNGVAKALSVPGVAK